MDGAVRSWLVSQLGTATDLADLEQRYNSLGSARAVAVQIIRERLAALRAQPATITVSGVVSVSFAESIKAYERQLAILEAGDPPAPDDPVVSDDGLGGVGFIQMIERRRR